MNRQMPSQLRSSSLLLLLAALALFAPRAARAAGEIYGRVTGYVYDPTGAPLAEVPVTLSGPALQQALNATSGENGRYEFLTVPPGEKYTVEVNVPGFTPVKRPGITVLLGQNSSVDVHLTVLTETQAVATYEIVEKVNPIVNPDSAQQGAVITTEKAEQTPIFHQVEGMPQQVAGVSPSASGGPNKPSTRGGLARYGKFLIDGMDTTDISDGSITSPMNFEAVENFDVVVGGMDAQYNSMGMIENVVTKTGGNRFTYDVSGTFAPSWSTAQNKVPSNQPDYTGIFINNNQPGPKTTFYSPVVNFGGPIIKDKLWFYASGQINFSNRESPITIGSTFENRNTKTTTMLGRLKLTWQATSRDRVSVALNLDHNTIDNAIGTASVTDLAEMRIDRGGYFFIVNYDHNFTDNLLFQLQTGMTSKLQDFDPESTVLPGANPDAISHRDVLSGVTDDNMGSISLPVQGNYQHERKLRFQFDPTLSWKLGAHQLKGGIQFSQMTDRQTTGVRGNERYLDRGGVCNPADPTTFSSCNQKVDFYNPLDPNGPSQTPLTTYAYAQNIGAFVQDRWTVNRSLTVIPGFRTDVGRLYDTSGRLITSLVGFGPRLAATWDIGGDRRNLVVANYGRSNDVGDVGLAQHGNAALLQTQATWDPVSKSFPTCDPTGATAVPGCSLAGGLSGRLFAKGQTPPHVDEVSLGYRHATEAGAVLGADATYRNYGNLWADEEVNRIYDWSGTRIVGFVNGQPQSILQAETPNSAYRRYAGLDLWVQGHPGNWDLLASYTLAYNWGTVSDYFDGYLNDPRIAQWYNGYLPDDRRHTIKGSIVYNTPFGLDLGFRLQYRTGAPMWENFNNPADSSQRYYRSPRGTGFATNSSTLAPDFNDPNSMVLLNNPTNLTLDFQARYNLGQPLHLTEQRLELVLLVVNLLNNTDATSLNDAYSPNPKSNRFGLANSRSSPLQAELLIRFRN